MSESRLVLLDLLAPHRPVDQAQLSRWGQEEWANVLKMARQHRIAPLLHWRLTHERAALSVPDAVRTALARAFRQATLRALAWQRELFQVQRLLMQAGIPCLALKGAYLALHVYPHPALRPLRDLDLLVPTAQVLAAQRILAQAGYSAAAPGNWEACLAAGHHLPPLQTPSGDIKIELHFSLHPAEARRTAPVTWDALQTRAITVQVAGQTLAYLAPTDLLLHLIVHAVYQHRFDNGPLLFSDLAYLLQQTALDWPTFWRQAEAQDWVKGCLLVLRMTAHYYDLLPIVYPAAYQSALTQVEPLIAPCACLTLSDFTAHADLHLATQFAGRSLAQRGLYLLRRMFPTPAEIAQGYSDASSHSPQIYLGYLRRYAVLLTQRLPKLFKHYHDAELRSDAQRSAALDRWLAAKAPRSE